MTIAAGGQGIGENDGGGHTGTVIDGIPFTLNGILNTSYLSYVPSLIPTLTHIGYLQCYLSGIQVDQERQVRIHCWVDLFHEPH